MSLPTKLYAWKDTSAAVQTYYTDTTSVTIGTHLYNNQGGDTGKTVDYISGSTFNVAYKLTATVTFNTGTVSGKTCTVPNGSSVTYTVVRTGYVSQSVTTTVNQENKTESKTLAKQNYTLTINTTPADATVTFSTGVVSGHTCTVPYDTTVSYTISKTNYVTSQTQTVTVTQDQTINAPALVPDMATLIIETDPFDATVNFSTGTVEGHSCTVQKGTTVSYNISKTGYITSQTYTKTVTQDETVTAPALVPDTVTLTINPTPSDATVTFSTGTVSGKTCTVQTGTSVTYTVSKNGYTSQSDTVTVNSNQTINVTITTDCYVPEVNEVVVNLTGSSKYEANTKFIPGRYRVEVAPGQGNVSDSSWDDLFSPYCTGTNMNHIETINEPFIVRAYCGSDATRSAPGTNPYSGSFKVNTASDGTRNHGVDVDHIFGAGGGNSFSEIAYLSKTYTSGGGNCLGNGGSSYDDLFKFTSYGGAGSCCHLLPVNGVFGTNYLRAYHCTPAWGNPGSAFGGGAGSTCNTVGTSWAYRGGNSPYGTGGGAIKSDSATRPAGTGIGAGGKTVHVVIGELESDMVVGAGAYFDGTNWIDEPGECVEKSQASSSHIRITYLGS